MLLFGLWAIWAPFLALAGGSASGGGYPQCWIRRGECLDNNEPPLRVASTDDQVAIKPQINHNVVGDSLPSASLDDCAEKCFDNVECR